MKTHGMFYEDDNESDTDEECEYDDNKSDYGYSSY